MPETRGLIADLTVEENIPLPTWTTGMDGRARLATVYQIMPELRDMARRKALLLSGGQQKMVALARALSVGRPLLLLHEPFEGVAPALAQRLSGVISQLRSERLSIVMSMSEMTHTEALLDRVWGIERGAKCRPEGTECARFKAPGTFAADEPMRPEPARRSRARQTEQQGS